jgi:hypothetical protein
MRFVLALALFSALLCAQKADPAKPQRLSEVYRGLEKNLKRQGRVEVVSGPQPVKMLNDKSPGLTWQVRLEGVAFRVTIQDSAELKFEQLVERIEKLPAAYRVMLPIVSESGKAGLAVYKNLGGAAAHGSQDYLNIVPGADTSVLLHEGGHILEQRYRSAHADVLERWKAAIEQDKVSVSGYGDSVAHEDLAEFSRLYALCLQAGADKLADLRRRSPRRFEIWASILKAAPSISAPQR